jgi:hypothetical protein
MMSSERLGSGSESGSHGGQQRDTGRVDRCISQYATQIESLILTLKHDKPHWGARKIRELLVKRLSADVRIPARSTIHAVLHRHGLAGATIGPASILG